MIANFPVDVESLEFVGEEFEPLANPRMVRSHIQVDEKDFLLTVHNVASYRVRNGNQVWIHPFKDADESDIELFLNGSVLGALLHQRGMLPLHGSSFVSEGKGVVICGCSGAGKSSVVAAFCQNGARLIDDDISPVRINEERVTIIPVKSSIKLWSDSLEKLKIRNDNLKRIRPSLDKFYVNSHEACPEETVLNHLFILANHNKDDFKVKELSGLAKFNALRRAIYRKGFLKGMPETEKEYFRQLVLMGKSVRVTQVFRPQICNIYDAMERIRKEMV